MMLHQLKTREPYYAAVIEPGYVVLGLDAGNERIKEQPRHGQ